MRYFVIYIEYKKVVLKKKIGADLESDRFTLGNNPVLSDWFSIPYPGEVTNSFHLF
ncbi:hypothetical protein HMPREF3038_02317 [Akkermansia sp. KLE1797]|nr:hypothetical protein HMPREF3038_02317 [Akkermansia sp. KLE1797]KXU53706.1 hypothetical protein HMPREF3039_02152 [Akkermansia sp. KLE1798]KZA03894.1 hypothetical protein HMPREF1326_02434 [Akkermansia sp. KLE1605]